MKKTYFSPCLRTLRLGSGTMMNSASSVAVGAKENSYVTEESDAFWSKTFGGTIIDDTNSSETKE